MANGNGESSGSNGNGRRKGKSSGVSDIPGEVRRRMNRNEHGMAAKILMRHLGAVQREGTELLVDTDQMSELLTEAVNTRGARLSRDERRALLGLARYLRDNGVLEDRDRRQLVRRAVANRHGRIAEALQQGV